MLNSAPLNTASLNTSEFSGYTTPIAWGLGGALNTSAVNGFSAPASRYVVGADGARTVYASWSGASDGARSIGYETWARDAHGVRIVLSQWTHSGIGARAVTAQWSRTEDGARLIPFGVIRGVDGARLIGYDRWHVAADGARAVQSQFAKASSGARAVFGQWSRDVSGARFTLEPWARDIAGVRTIPFGVFRDVSGAREILAEWARTAAGAREMAERTYGRSVYGARSISVRYTRALAGARQQLRVWARTTTGARSLDLATWGRTADGARLIGYSDWSRTVDGSRVLLETFYATEIGYRRIADAALARFEVYRGVDAAPDLDGAPWETFTAAPHETAALDPGHTYRFVLRRRNAWGLVSQNRDETVIVIDGAGELDIAPPSAPFGVAITPAAAGVMVVTASYGADADADRGADTWLIYAAIGADPDPETDVPATVAMSGGTVATLRYETPAFADGAAVHVIVRARRTGPPVSDSVNTAAATATAETQGPQSPAGQIFFGRTAAQASD